MADPKKDGGKKDGGKKDAKGGGGDGGLGMEAEILFWIIILVIIGFVVFPTILKFFGFGVSAGGVGEWWKNFSFAAERAFSSFLSGLIFTSIFSCFLFGIGILYAKFKVGQIGNEQTASPEKPGETWGKEQAAVSQISSRDPLAFVGNLPGAAKSVIAPPPENLKWKEVKKHMESGNQAEWRLAILEADILLYDMLDQMGYEGDSIGEKLKRVEPASFNTLDEAWRAHKVRNIIAHEGGSYVLSRSEAERAIRQYESVFKEFYFI